MIGTTNTIFKINPGIYDEISLVPTMTTLTLDHTTIIGSFPGYQNQDSRTGAFDGNDSTICHSQQNPTYPLSIGFLNNAYKSYCSSIFIKRQSTISNRTPKVFDLEGSNGNGEWTYIQRFDSGDGYDTRTFLVMPYNNYYYGYRIKIYSVNGGDFCTFGTLKFLGHFQPSI